MLSNTPSENLSSDFSRLFEEVVTNLVAIIETKHTTSPRERASQMIERAIGCPPSDTLDPQVGMKLVRVSRCVEAARGLGFTADEIVSIMRPVAIFDGVERFSVSALRGSLEDLLVAQEERVRAELLGDWPRALFLLSRGGGSAESRLILFGAYMRGFDYFSSSSSWIEDVLQGGPACRLKVSYAESVGDFIEVWAKASAETKGEFSLRDRAERYQQIRHLFKAEDDPAKVARICRTLASPVCGNSSGLKVLFLFPHTEREQRLLLFSWASVAQQEWASQLKMDHLEVPPTRVGVESLVALQGTFSRMREALTQRSAKAVVNGMRVSDPHLSDARVAHRIALELLGVDLSTRGAWAAVLLRSKTFEQVALEAPDRIIDLVGALQARSPAELRELLARSDDALYRDALYTNSSQLLLALLPHVSPRGEELPVLMSVLRAGQLELCRDAINRASSGVYHMGFFEVDHGPPQRITAREDLLFAWRYDPRFADAVTRYYREWYGLGEEQGSARGESRASARSELVSFVQQYLAEHRNFFDTYRYLQGERSKKLSFMFDDSPFPDEPERGRAFAETFEVMKRNLDLSLRFFSFLDYECKRVPGHAESLVERFMRQSFDRFSVARDTRNRSFPGNGWRVHGIRLRDFGLTPDKVGRLFGARRGDFAELDDLNILVTQGMVAVWCPRCVESHVDGVPQAWVFFNRHYHPSGNCVGSLVDLPRLEQVLGLMESGKEFRRAGELADHFGQSKKELAWIGNLSGTLSNSYPFDTGPFRGESMIARAVIGKEPDGHVHKHYLVQRSLAGAGIEFQLGLERFQDAHNDLYRAYTALHDLFCAGYLYPFSLFKKGYSVNSLRPEDLDTLARLDLDEAPSVNPNTLLMLLYAEDVRRAVRTEKIKATEASVITYEDPLMINRETPKIALDCATLRVGTWGELGWREIDDLSEYDWPQRAKEFTKYFAEAFMSNSADLKSVSRRWIGL